MRHFKAFTFYYMLPFSIYIFFSALQSPSSQRFWGMIVLGAFFAAVGLLLMQNALKAEKPEEPLAKPVEPVFKQEEVAVVKPMPAVIIDVAKEKEWEEKVRTKDAQILLLQQQINTLQADVSRSGEQLKSREEAIQELRFEVRSLLAISRGKSSPAAS
ncbi:MAG: hypothetical protein WCN87_03565 [Chlamydiota bacterium]